jgi:hypothetical protein
LRKDFPVGVSVVYIRVAAMSRTGTITTKSVHQISRSPGFGLWITVGVFNLDSKPAITIFLEVLYSRSEGRN